MLLHFVTDISQVVAFCVEQMVHIDHYLFVCFCVHYNCISCNKIVPIGGECKTVHGREMGWWGWRMRRGKRRGTLLLNRVLLACLLTLENRVLALNLRPCGHSVGKVTDDLRQLAYLWQRGTPSLKG